MAARTEYGAAASPVRWSSSAVAGLGAGTLLLVFGGIALARAFRTPVTRA